MVTFDYWTANNEPTAELGYIISFLKSAHLLITLLQVLKCPYGQKMAIFVIHFGLVFHDFPSDNHRDKKE